MDARLLASWRAELGARALRHPLAAVGWYAAAAAAERLRAEAAAALTVARRALQAGNPAALEPLLQAATAAIAAELPAVVAALRRAGQLCAAGSPDLFGGGTWRERLLVAVLERLLVNRAAAPLLLDPRPHQPAGLSGQGVCCVALLFDQPLAVTHELYPLFTDACAFAAESASLPGLAPLAAHTSWLTAAGELTRAIRYDAASDTLLEADLEPRLRPAVALAIACDPAAHWRVDAVLSAAGIPCGNPACHAAVADDKWECYRRWRDHGVPTPPTCLLPATATAADVRRIAAQAVTAAPGAGSAGWFVQPRHGTEGRGVVWVAPEGDVLAAIAAAWRQISTADDAILRPQAGRLGILQDDETRAWDLRLNVCFDGSAWRATSGYLLVAPSSAAPLTSVSRGGQARPLSWLDGRKLVAPGAARDGSLSWSGDWLAAAARTAEAAARALPPVSLAGVDIKLDASAAAPVCSVLDLNPRPAGLLHADLLDGTGPGLGGELWQGLRRAARAGAA